MPPSWVGAIMHSSRSIGAGISKCSFMASTASSESRCIHVRRASVPFRVRSGSASRIARASSIVAPGRMRSASACCAAMMRASSSWPQR